MLPLINACFWQMESTFSGPHAWMVMIKWSQQQHWTKPSSKSSMRNLRRGLMIWSIPQFLLKFVVQTPSLMREPSNLASTASLQVTSHKLQHARSTMGCLEFPLSVLHRVVGASEFSLCFASCCRNFQFFTFMCAEIGQKMRQYNWTAVRLIITLVGINRDSVYFNKNPAMTLANLKFASNLWIIFFLKRFQSWTLNQTKALTLCFKTSFSQAR